MKVAVMNDTQLLSCDPDISDTSDFFSESDLERINDPIFYELQVSTGIDAEILEQMAPEAKLENVLRPKEYKQWKELPISEKQRLARRVHMSKEYKEYWQAVVSLQEMRKNAGETNYYTGGINTSAAQLFVEGNALNKGVSIVANQGKKITKKLAREFSDAPKYSPTVNGNSNSDNLDTERNILHKTTKASTRFVILAGNIASVIGAPILIIAIPILIFLVMMTSFFLLQKKVSENAGIMPYYAQADYPTTPFNGKTIKSDGCGITSMAMVISLFKNETITPPVLAEIANSDSSYNTVNSHRAINNLAARFDLGPVEEMGGPERNCCKGKKFDLSYLQDKIQNGCPVIVSVSGGYYNPSGGGHYLALYGAGSGGVFVYDAGSRAKYKASVENDGSAWGIVFENAKHIWIFQPYGGTYLKGDNNEESVFLNLKQAGFSNAAAAGVIGNMYQESSHGLSDLKLDAESRDGSIGLLQWTSGRRKSLETLSRNRNKDWFDIAVQIEYLFQELNSNAQWRWTNYASKHYPASDNLSLEEYKQLSDPELAAEVFQAKFVRPSYEKSNISYRKSKAMEVYLKYANR